MLAIAMFDLPTRNIGGYIIRYLVPRAPRPYLIGSADNAENLGKVITSTDLLIAGGHGSDGDILGQDDINPILDADNLPDMSGKIIWLVSCDTGKDLGPALISAGAKAFVGFQQDLVWIASPLLAFTPWFDNQSMLVMKPIMDGINTLLNGKTVQESYDVMISGFTDSLSVVDDELYAQMIQWNIDNAVILGDKTATINPTNIPVMPIPPPPIIFVP
jgi:hypothetical protein